MPIYEYRCQACSYTFDLKQGFDAEPIATCLICSGQAPRVFSMPAVIYKGSGFYTTDYKQKENGYKQESGNGSPKSESESESKSETKSESKEESKAESKVGSSSSKSSSSED